MSDGTVRKYKYDKFYESEDFDEFINKYPFFILRRNGQNLLRAVFMIPFEDIF